MDLNKLESVIRKIRSASAVQEDKPLLFIAEKVSAIKKAFNDYW